MPNVFNAGNVVKQLIWTRVILDLFPRELTGHWRSGPVRK
jgi:hypothetical protein